MTQASPVTRRMRVIVPILSVSVAAAFSLIGRSWYSSHQQACAARATTLNVMRDVIVIATTPGPKQRQSVEQAREIAAFRAAVFARIDKARC